MYNTKLLMADVKRSNSFDYADKMKMFDAIRPLVPIKQRFKTSNVIMSEVSVLPSVYQMSCS